MCSSDLVRERILDSLRRLVQQNWRRLCTELQTYVTLQGRDSIRLVDFLKDQGVELESLYRGSGRSGWTCLKRQAGEFFLDHLGDPQWKRRRRCRVERRRRNGRCR